MTADTPSDCSCCCFAPVDGSEAGVQRIRMFVEGNLLAEIGIDPAAAREVIAEDRAARCADRDRVLPERGTAFLDVVMPHEAGLPEAAGMDIPAPARRPAEWR